MLECIARWWPTGTMESQVEPISQGEGSLGPRNLNIEIDECSTEHHTGANVGKNQLDDRPLSWEQARIRVRQVLEEYMRSTLPVFKGDRDRKEDTSVWYSFWFQHDLDFYAAAIPVSLALLILSCISYTTDNDDSALNARADRHVYKKHIVAASLLVSGTVFSIMLVRRRAETSKKDSDVAKRHTIARFLLAMKKTKEENKGRTSDVEIDVHQAMGSDSDTIPLSGTSLTDIYPTYRLAEKDSPGGGAWHRVPTLLLARGDYISLQVGDIAPARCAMLRNEVDGQHSTPVVIAGGDRLTLDSVKQEAATSLSALPRGRSTLSADSRDLLTLCNHMRIFVLQETPLEGFLRLPPVQHKPPQLHRQIQDIRPVLFLVAVTVFLLTLVIILVRPHLSDRDLSLVLPLPFLAALGVLPVTTPASAFFLEVLGTSRILVAVHSHASIRSSFHDGSVKRKSSEGMLFVRYCFATASSRLSLQVLARRIRNCFRRFSQENSSRDDDIPSPGSVHVPPASVFLLEKLGVATAFALVDDELACEPHSSPQQLLIPSGKGLKLLDLCRYHDADFEDESDSEKSPTQGDSDSDEEQQYQHISLPRRKLKALRIGYRRKTTVHSDVSSSGAGDNKLTDAADVQFEDPLWWQHLPSLKCIGLACLLADCRHKAGKTSSLSRAASSQSLGSKQHQESSDKDGSSQHSRGSSIVQGVSQAPSKSARRLTVTFAPDANSEEESARMCEEIRLAEKALSQHVCSDRSRRQLRSLARCIGFSDEGNTFGHRGDLSPFRELMRFHVISTRLLSERLEIDAHALGLEESRRWGELRPDSTSVVVQDRRSRGYQLLTVGDPRVVIELCQEAWQGENSTIFPLSSTDKKSILDTSSNWNLADLDVAAFCYTPVPYTLDQRIGGFTKRNSNERTAYLVDNANHAESQSAISEDWALIKNQIFLGVLGSSVVPRKEIEPLIEAFNEAGVRFVYFSPRNMRRTKELASDVGIDVAWNCAISLRPLDEGEDDAYRMTSTYADWDVNAKLPHGIDDVRRHLKEVDNVPLLVSLFTDVTKDTTKEMVKTFQDYSDTVVAMGLSHLPRNARIFAVSDLAVGVDVLTEAVYKAHDGPRQLDVYPRNSVLPCEVAFVSSIAAHSCVFNLLSASATSLMPYIIERARAALDATTSSALFIISGCFSFSLYVLLCVCTASTTIPYVPILGSVLYLQVTLPLIGLSMAMSDPDGQSMSRVPPKNDQSVTFARNEGKRLYVNAFLKALAPAVLPQILHLIAFGELIIEFEPELVLSLCSNGEDIDNVGWVSLVRCGGLREYSGDARTSAGSLVFAEMVLCVVLASSSFVYRTIPVWREPPWERNRAWVYSLLLAIAMVAMYLGLSLEDGTFSALPWYFFLLALVIPFICILCAELVKLFDYKHEKRAVTLRRLQFETRLGMWSPK